MIPLRHRSLSHYIYTLSLIYPALISLRVSENLPLLRRRRRLPHLNHLLSYGAASLRSLQLHYAAAFSLMSFLKISAPSSFPPKAA